MKEINIASTLVDKRKEKGITQDELAKYIGVSKASVSKWETRQSYPDITFLPQLAAYFNISIDDLIGYKPQMCKKEICKLYHKLSADFITKPFDEVLDNCRKIIKKYYACFPLLLQMGVLILVHSNSSTNGTQKTRELIMEAKELFVRVKTESTDVENIKQAQYMEANCNIALGDSQSALELLEAINKPMLPVEMLLATAYQMQDKSEDAKATLQIGIYQHVVGLFSIFPFYVILSANDPKQYKEVLHRAFVLANIFDIKHLLPTTFIELNLAAAQGYIVQGKTEESLRLLKKFTNIITSNNYKLTPHSDTFFDLVDNWLGELDLGAGLAKNEKILKHDVVDSVINNPVFSVLFEDNRFKIIVEKLKQLKVKQNEKNINKNR